MAITVNNLNSMMLLHILNRTTFEQSNTLTQLSTGSRINAGRDDPAVSAEATSLLGTIRGARVVELPGKHLAPVEHPREFVEALTA